jgi:hypothetical protein
VKLLVIAVVCLSCSKPSEHRAALDRYVNADMKQHWADLRWIQKPFETTTRTSWADQGWMTNAMRLSIARTDRILAGTRTVQVPAPARALHGQLVELVTDYRSAATEILAAYDDRERVGARLDAVHERVRAMPNRYTTWSRELDRMLAEHGVVFDRSAVPEFTPSP